MILLLKLKGHPSKKVETFDRMRFAKGTLVLTLDGGEKRYLFDDIEDMELEEDNWSNR